MSYLPLILDLAVLALLVLFAWRGAAKGLILSLCGLLTVILAFFGATWISNQFREPVSEFINPYVSGYVETVLESSLDQLGFDSTPNAEPDATPSFQIPTDGMVEYPVDPQVTLNELLNALENSDLLPELMESVTEAIDFDSLTSVDSAVTAIADFLSFQIARVGLFFLSFLLILLLWWLVSRMLDLAFRLPVLRTFNKAGGLIFGLVKGTLVLLVACWALRFFALVPVETAEQTKIFLHFLNFQLF